MHIADNYWANTCGGQYGSDFTHISFTNPGHEGYWLGVNYDSPVKSGIEAAADAALSLYPAPTLRKALDKAGGTVTQLVIPTEMDKATGATDAWDDALGAAITDASDYNGGSDVELFIVTGKVYEANGPWDDGSTSSTRYGFSLANRFVVIVHPTGSSYYQPVYIHFVYEQNFKDYYGIP